jgi:hypothetical protein
MQPPEYPPPPQSPSTPQPWPGGAQPVAGQRALRPGSVTAASVLLIILAVVPILVAILAFAGAAVFSRANGRIEDSAFSNMLDVAQGLIIVFGVVSLVYGVFKLIAGIRVLAGSNAWRITAIVFCALAAALWVLALIGAINGPDESSRFTTPADTGPNPGGIVFSLVFLAMNIVVIVLLARAGDWFRGTSRTPVQQWPPQGQFPPPGQYQG